MSVINVGRGHADVRVQTDVDIAVVLITIYSVRVVEGNVVPMRRT